MAAVPEKPAWMTGPLRLRPTTSQAVVGHEKTFALTVEGTFSRRLRPENGRWALDICNLPAPNHYVPLFFAFASTLRQRPLVNRESPAS